MVVPIRQNEGDLSRFIDWALEKLGLSTPPQPETVTLACPTEISPGLKAWLKETTHNEYESVMVGRSGDGNLALIRKDGALDDLHIEGDSFLLCTRPYSNKNLSADQALDFTCGYFTPPDTLLTELIRLDATQLGQETIQMLGPRTMQICTAEKINRLYFSLSPEMRNSLHGIDATAAPTIAWRLSSIGIARVGNSPVSADFYEDAARVFTVKLFLDGRPVIDDWDGLGEKICTDTTFLSADNIAKTVGMIYSRPDEAKATAISDPVFARRIGLLAALGFLREDQREYLIGSSVSPPYSDGSEDPRCAALPR